MPSVDAYLRRLRLAQAPPATFVGLRELHRRHLLTLPFENLDIALGRPLDLSLSALHTKLVERRRGGFCYELNGLFAWLLEQLGFSPERLSGRVFGAEGRGPEFDHLLLRVELEGQPWIADVGFGDSFVEPLPLTPDVETRQGGARFRLRQVESGWRLERRTDGDWEAQYDFTTTPRSLGDFEPMCRYQETSPRSAFTRKAVCSRLSEQGRLTLSNDRWIRTTANGRSEERVPDTDTYRRLLAEHFGIELDPGAQLERLLAPRRSD